MSLLMKSVANPFNRLSFIVDRILLLMYFSILKHLSLEAVVTGKVANIFRSTWRLGKVAILSHAFKVSRMDFGGFFTSFHSSFHLKNSPSISSNSPGKWSLYNFTQPSRDFVRLLSSGESETPWLCPAPGRRYRKRCRVEFCFVNLSFNWNITVSK